MISPGQMKNKTFTLALRGYAKTEVDAYIDALVEQYTELYRAHGVLSQKNAELEKELEMMKGSEDALRRALIHSQNAASMVIDHAKERGEALESLAREKCNEVLAEFHEEVRAERERLIILRTQIANFRSRIFAEYQEHIEALDRVTRALDEDDWDMTPTAATKAVLARLRGDFERRTRAEQLEDERLDEEIGEVLDQIVHSRRDEE